MHIGSRCAGTPCVRIEGSRMRNFEAGRSRLLPWKLGQRGSRPAQATTRDRQVREPSADQGGLGLRFGNGGIERPIVVGSALAAAAPPLRYGSLPLFSVAILVQLVEGLQDISLRLDQNGTAAQSKRAMMIDDEPSSRSSSDTLHALTVALVNPDRGACLSCLFAWWWNLAKIAVDCMLQP